MICKSDICLRPLSINDTEFILELRNNLEDSLSFLSEYPLYDFEHVNWLNNKEKDIDMIILFKGEKVGRVRLTNIDYKNQKCEFGIHVKKEFRNKGIAYTASVLIIEYVFKNLPIQKIYLHTLKDNEKAFKFFKKLGFEIEGILRNEVFKDGKFRDVLIMSIFKENWMKYEKNENYI